MATKKNGILKTALGYGVGAIGLDLSYGMFYSYLSYYLTSLSIPAAFLIIITPLARIWDGINDPLMGTIVDNTRTKQGKYRPWILIGAICNALVLFLLFTSFGLKGLPLYIYIAVMYVLWGMTNTMADIPYWSMVPSFTSEEKERNLVATVARAFSGIGQGIISILTPIICPLLGSGISNNEKGYTPEGFSRWAGICSIALVIFALICVLVTKETNVVYGEKKKFNIKQIFNVIKTNDQLVVFIIFAMLSNAGWYLTSSTAVYYFTDSLGDSKLQSTFQLIGTVGSVLGLLVVPVLTKWFSKRQTYTISLSTAIVGYALMFMTGPILKLNPLIMDICYILASVGVSSMFVSQTIFLADIVDYGEYKNGERSESITFSMKGFLQKMAYTIQTMVLFGGLALMNYNAQKDLNNGFNDMTKTGIGIICFGIPMLFLLASLMVFRSKFKVYGELADKVHDYIIEKRENEEKAQ